MTMPNKNSIESEIEVILELFENELSGKFGDKITKDEATLELKNLIQREVKKGRVELMEDVRLAKPAKLKSVRGKEDASSARIGYIGGWNAYYEKLQPILKQVEKQDRLEELEG